MSRSLQVFGIRNWGAAAVCTALLLFCVNGCKKPYVSPHVSPATGYLVVDGYISGNSDTRFLLSRTIQLSADSVNPQEQGASVQVEGEDGSVFPLIWQGGGVYSAGALPLSSAVQYRLRIHTVAGGEYLSDYVPYKVTPAIDSLNWVENAEGVVVYANAHDPSGNTRYYQWSYDEDWEYHSGEVSEYKYVPTGNVVPRTLDDVIFRCWRSGSSSNILINSTEKLSQDVVYQQPLRQIPVNSEILSVMYSILVRQYALNAGAYEFLNRMKKNTESLGSIFDPQPSELNGNIHSVSNAGEPVIGYVSAGTVEQQRIFIARYQVPDWSYIFRCQFQDTLVSVAGGELEKFFGGGSYTPTLGHMGNITIDGYYANYTSCVDCTTQGGTTTMPPFWPY